MAITQFASGKLRYCHEKRMSLKFYCKFEINASNSPPFSRMVNDIGKFQFSNYNQFAIIKNNIYLRTSFIIIQHTFYTKNLFVIQDCHASHVDNVLMSDEGCGIVRTTWDSGCENQTACRTCLLEPYPSTTKVTPQII